MHLFIRELTLFLVHVLCAETTYDKLLSLPKLSSNLPVEDFLRDEIVNEQFTRYDCLSTIIVHCVSFHFALLAHRFHTHFMEVDKSLRILVIFYRPDLVARSAEVSLPIVI